MKRVAETNSLERKNGVFERPDESFEIHPSALDWILADAANPLNKLAQIIPKDSTVLDIGAGNGVLGRLLRRVHGSVTIDGLEPNPAAAANAAPFYRNLFAHSVEEFLSSSHGVINYDFVVMADVIEHLARPDKVLAEFRRRIAPSTRICVSTPNVAFVSVRIALLNGVFDYVDSGILERTHLRFFTLESLRLLSSATQFVPQTIYLLQRDPLTTEIPIESFRVNPLVLLRLLRDQLATTYQFLFVLSTGDGKTIVEVCGNPGRAVTLRYLLRRIGRYTSRLRGKNYAARDPQ